jgi:DNA-directed RNA polymerase subunit M/transcription elongation factor TFIIS
MSYTCSVCGYSSDCRAEFVELRDPVGVKKLNEKGKRVKQIVEGDFICIKCSLELYSPSGQPRSIRAVCPKCGEVIELWL